MLGDALARGLDTARVVVAQVNVNVSPDPGAIPGSGPVQRIVNGLAFFALLIAVGAIVLGGAMWGAGNIANNTSTSVAGKRAILYSVVGMIVVGAASILVNWAFNLGGTAG